MTEDKEKQSEITEEDAVQKEEIKAEVPGQEVSNIPPDASENNADDSQPADGLNEENSEENANVILGHVELDDDQSEGGSEQQHTVVGVRFRPAGPMLYFKPNDTNPKLGDTVIVEAERGLELGRVVQIKQVEELPPPPIRRIVRITDERDELIKRENEERNKNGLEACEELIEELSLPMKLVEVNYQHSANKAIFYFSAEGRIDFRELVRRLAQRLHIRVEMRQIGIRDEAKLVGGLGPCGLPTCCSYWIDEFRPVSIRMAKEQNLTLNPEKVSGMCGRLMCCLGYEAETYKSVQKGLPKIGKKVDTWIGRGRVLEINIFSRMMRLELEGREYVAVNIDDFLSFKNDPDAFQIELKKREEKEREKAIEKITNQRYGGASPEDPSRPGKKRPDSKSEGRNKPGGADSQKQARPEKQADGPDAAAKKGERTSKQDGERPHRPRRRRGKRRPGGRKPNTGSDGNQGNRQKSSGGGKQANEKQSSGGGKPQKQRRTNQNRNKPRNDGGDRSKQSGRAPNRPQGGPKPNSGKTPSGGDKSGS